ncbi:MAG: hypothetical protein IIX86_01890 [Clostridia bacterium]|nr:hypothetical protein [Clostridia bacterium]
MKNVNNFGGFCTEFAHQNRLQKFFLFFSKKPELFRKKSVYIGEGAKTCASAILDSFFHLCYNEKKQDGKAFGDRVLAGFAQAVIQEEK